MNSVYLISALVVTFGYIVYYAVTIARDIVASRKTKGGDVESFEVGDGEGGGESSPRYIGENGETEKPVEFAGNYSEVDDQPHSDIAEQLSGNSQPSVGHDEDFVVDPVSVSDVPHDYRKVLGYAREVALEAPVKPEHEKMLESDEYLEDMLEGINNESQIRYIITKL